MPKKPSPNFKRSEFSTEGYILPVEGELTVALEDLRAHFGKPLYITSGYRSKALNNVVGSTEASQHRKLPVMATDIYIEDVSTTLIYEYLNEKYSTTYGIGLYNTFVHFDVREKKARWIVR